MRPVVVLVALVLIGGGVGGQEKKTVQPVRTWSGRLAAVEKEGLIKQAPTIGYLVDQPSLEKLWRAWRGDEKPPQVDFKQQVVFIHTVKGPNTLKTRYQVDGDGDLVPMAESTLVAGPGFSYVIDVVPRAGFKTIRGKALMKTE